MSAKIRLRLTIIANQIKCSLQLEMEIKMLFGIYYAEGMNWKKLILLNAGPARVLIWPAIHLGWRFM